MIHNDERRTKWLSERRKGIGSSDAAAVSGFSPWRDEYTTYLDKIGELPDEEPKVEQIVGLLMEPVIAFLYEQRTKKMLVQPEMMYHKDRPWMLANLDRITEDGKTNVELKNASYWSGKQNFGAEYTDDVPVHYLIQTHHQMEVAGLEHCDLAVLIGGSDFRIYKIRRSERMIKDLVKIEADFWQRVIERRPPDPKFDSKPTQEAIKRAIAFGPEIEIKDEATVDLVKSFEAWKDFAKDADEHIEEIKATLVHQMSGATSARLQDGTILERKQIHRKAYTVKESDYYQFRVKHAEHDERVPFTTEEFIQRMYGRKTAS